jgi:hypothetical protein
MLMLMLMHRIDSLQKRMCKLKLKDGDMLSAM